MLTNGLQGSKHGGRQQLGGCSFTRPYIYGTLMMYQAPCRGSLREQLSDYYAGGIGVGGDRCGRDLGARTELLA